MLFSNIYLAISLVSCLGISDTFFKIDIMIKYCLGWQEVRSFRPLYFSNLDAMGNPKLLICKTTGFQIVGVMPIIDFKVYKGWICSHCPF
jgi:hypothetical protein